MAGSPELPQPRKQHLPGRSPSGVCQGPGQEPAGRVEGPQRPGGWSGPIHRRGPGEGLREATLLPGVRTEAFTVWEESVSGFGSAFQTSVSVST